MKKQFLIACLCLLSTYIANPAKAQNKPTTSVAKKETQTKPATSTSAAKKETQAKPATSTAKKATPAKPATSVAKKEAQPKPATSGTMASTSKSTEAPAPTPTNASTTTAPTASPAATKPASQTSTTETGYVKGDLLVNAGISFGIIGYNYSGYGSSSGFLPLAVNAEYSINEQFAVGGYAGYYSRKYRFADDYRFSVISFGARGTFHGSAFLNEALNANINAEKLDLYASFIVGFETLKWTYKGNAKYFANDSRVIIGPTLGARYMIQPNLGVYFEGGRGAFGLATLGVSAKF